MVDRRVTDLFRKKREQHANTGALGQLEAVHPSLEEVWDAEWKNQHLKHCVEQLRSEVSRRTFDAFSLVVIQGRPVADACDELGMNPNQIYKAKARMLRRVRGKMAEYGCEEAAGA
jgi:DNA-directed RNA polymerase specialized sigma24 family protein